MGSTASLPRGAALLRTYSPAVGALPAERLKPLPTGILCHLFDDSFIFRQIRDYWACSIHSMHVCWCKKYDFILFRLFHVD